LVRADLAHQPAARSKVPRRSRDDLSEIVEPIRSSEERVCRFPGQDIRLESRIAHRDIRRIRDDDISAKALRERGEPSALRDGHVSRGSSDTSQVCPSDLERRRVGIGQPHGGPVEREFIGEGEADRTGPRSEVDDATIAIDREREVDGSAGYPFGLGPRDEHTLVDSEIKPPKGPLTEHVLERFSGATPSDHRVEVSHHPLGHRLVEDVGEGTVGERDLTDPAGLGGVTEHLLGGGA